MTSLHWQTITPEMRQVMAAFAQSEIGGRFYLAGGTALALQLGHRCSVDLDYFTQTEDVPVLIEPLNQSLKSLGPELADSSWGNLVFLAAGVRTGRKDFYDLYAICQLQPLRELLDLAPRKYPGVRDFEAQVVKRLVYFERADQDAPLPLLEPVAWQAVKDFFRQQAVDIGRGWIGTS